MILEANLFQPIIDVFEAIIKFFAEDLGLSWGLSIVLLTFFVRALILPLSLKQIRSMRAMQALAPQLKEIQQKYKDDKERQQREMMTFYKEHGINPLASCWPLLLQLPVFIALYGLLRGTSFQQDVQSTVDAGTNTVSFLFVHNILVKGGCDSVDACNTTDVPLAPPVNSTAILIALIVLFIVTQLGAGLVMSARVEGAQRALMFVFPLIIAPFIITQPAGLAIYWVATNVWTLGQQYVVQRIVPAPEKPTPEEERKAKPPPPPPRKRKRRR